MQDQSIRAISPVVKPGSLAHMVMTGDAATLEDTMREMLRPMLKSWLDDNLPSTATTAIQWQERFVVTVVR
jgi:cell pole-organizing protein PopZ